MAVPSHIASRGAMFLVPPFTNTEVSTLRTVPDRVDALDVSIEYVREYVTPAIHGAQGRGVAGDETAALQAWALDANPDKALDGEYEASGEIVIASGSQIVGDGKIVSTRSGLTESAISCAGTLALIGSGSAARGGFTATVALDGGQTINEGDWLMMRNATDGSWGGVAWPGSRSHYRAGEPVRVAHVLSATSFVASTPFRDSYTSVELYKIDAATFAWDGPEVETAGAYALSLDTVLDARVRGTFSGGTSATLSLERMIGGVVSGTTVDCRAASAGAQYGMIGSGLHGTRFVSCNLYGRRHGVTLAGEWWINRDVVYEGCRIGSDGVLGYVSADCRGNSENTIYKNCEIGSGVAAGGRGVSVEGGMIGGDYGCIQFNEIIGGRVSVSGADISANGAFAGGIIRGATTATVFQYLVKPLHIQFIENTVDIRGHTQEYLMTLYQRGHTVPVDILLRDNTFRGVNASLGRIFRTTLFSGTPLSRRIEIHGNVRETSAGAILTGPISKLDGGYADLGDGVLRIQSDGSAWAVSVADLSALDARVTTLEGAGGGGTSVDVPTITTLPATISVTEPLGWATLYLDAAATNATVEYQTAGNNVAMRQVTLAPPANVSQRLLISRYGVEPVHLLGVIDDNAEGYVIDGTGNALVALTAIDDGGGELWWGDVAFTAIGTDANVLSRLSALESQPLSGKLLVFADTSARDASGFVDNGLLCVTVAGEWFERTGDAWVASDKATIIPLVDHAFGTPAASSTIRALLAVPGRLIPYDDDLGLLQ